MLALFFVLTYVVAVQGAPPCESPKWECAYLSNVTDGLPEFVRAVLFGSSRLVTAPSDTGVSYFVLPGSIPVERLGDHNGSFNLLRVGQLAADHVEQIPVLLHVWLRALCIE